MTTTTAWPTDPHDAVADETLNLTYRYAERICKSVDPVILQDIDNSSVLSALDADGKCRVHEVIRERVSHALERWMMRDRDHFLDVLDDLYAGDGDGWVNFVPPPSQGKTVEHDQAVIACMTEQGFTAYGAAEAWLARQPHA
jgi:hypothetical protein